MTSLPRPLSALWVPLARAILSVFFLVPLLFPALGFWIGLSLRQALGTGGYVLILGLSWLPAIWLTSGVESFFASCFPRLYSLMW